MCKVRDNCVAVVQSRAREGGERARGIDKIVQLILEGDRAQGDHFNGRAELLNQWAKSMRNIREKIGTTILERVCLSVCLPQLIIFYTCYFPPSFFLRFFIFRPYFIWERKIFKSNGFFFTKFANNYCSRNVKKYIHRIQLT